MSWRSIDAADLRGTLWLLPVANPLAMEAIARNTPVDMLDMNRLFPGQPAGWGWRSAGRMCWGWTRRRPVC